jgi:outer membrane protein
MSKQKTRLKILPFILGFFFIFSVYADAPVDLVQVYHDALYNDPTFQKAQADWLAAREDVPIARAGYLPLINLQGEGDIAWQKNSPVPPVNSNGAFFGYDYGLSLLQPIFNYSIWAGIQGAHASVKSALAIYFAAGQDLMYRTASAYFAVLSAYDTLRFTIANKQAVFERLETAQQKFKVGLIAITDVYDAQSAYDQAVAAEITNRNNLNNQIENLRAITGKHYYSFKAFSKNLPLLTPEPNHIENWVQIAEQQNYTLRAQNFAVIAAAENIKQQRGNGLPVVNLVGQYQSTNTFAHPNNIFNSASQTALVGVEINAPVYQGGLTVAQTRQARYDYLSATDQLEYVHRAIVNQTRQAFLGVIAGISQIQADRQSILSAENALKATKAGYAVGTRTMVDVLIDLSSLYQAQQKYATDQYTYILSTMQLKEATGALSTTDFAKVSHWMTVIIEASRPADLVAVSLDNVSQNVKHERKQHPQQHPRKIEQISTSTHYSIQLDSDPNLKTAQADLAQLPANIRAKARVVKVGELYKIQYGQFDRLADARAALVQLTKKLGDKNKPWIIKS